MATDGAVDTVGVHEAIEDGEATDVVEEEEEEEEEAEGGDQDMEVDEEDAEAEEEEVEEGVGQESDSSAGSKSEVARPASAPSGTPPTSVANDGGRKLKPQGSCPDDSASMAKKKSRSDDADAAIQQDDSLLSSLHVSVATDGLRSQEEGPASRQVFMPERRSSKRLQLRAAQGIKLEPPSPKATSIRWGVGRTWKICP